MLFWAPIDADKMKEIPGHVLNKDEKPALPVKVHGKTYYFPPFEAVDVPYGSAPRFRRLKTKWGGLVTEIVRGSKEEQKWINYRANGTIKTEPNKPEVVIKAVFPSKKVLDRLNKDDLHEIAECAGLDVNPGLSKDDLVAALEAARS